MPQEFYARLMLAFIGIAFGAVPLIFACVRKQYILGVLSLLACSILSAVGFPYLALPLAGVAFYLIHKVAKHAEEEKIKKNRTNYKKKMQEQMEDPDLRLSGHIENKKAAGSAWPPVDQMVDEVAVQEYIALAEKEEKERMNAEQSSVQS